jgi:hypothetical protein
MAQRIIRLNESDLKNMIKSVLNEMHESDEDYYNDLLTKYNSEMDVDKATGGKEYSGEFEDEIDIDDIDDDVEDNEENQPETDDEYYIVTCVSKDGESSESHIVDANEKGEYEGADGCEIEGPFETREDAEKKAMDDGLEITDDDRQTDTTEVDNAISALSDNTPEPEEEHMEGDIIYYENTPIEYKGGKYHMTIEDGFNMGDSKCPKIEVVGSSLNDVKNEYNNLWDNYYYKEHGKYVKDMEDKKMAQRDFSGVEGISADQINMEELPVIVDLDKAKIQ